MDGIIKLTCENGLWIGLSKNENQYYLIWGHTKKNLSINIETENWFEFIKLNKGNINIPLFTNDDTLYNIIKLDKEEDFPLAEKVLRAAL